MFYLYAFINVLELHRRVYGARSTTSGLGRSIRYSCWPLVPNSPKELDIHLQRHMDGAQSASSGGAR